MTRRPSGARAGFGVVRLPTLGLVVGADIVVLVATFLPWTRTGLASRNSYSMVRSVELLDVVHTTAGRVVVRAWYLVPVLAALVPLLAGVHRPRFAGAVALAMAFGVVGLAVVTVLAPVESGVGPIVAIAGSAVLGLGGAMLLRRGAPGGPID